MTAPESTESNLNFYIIASSSGPVCIILKYFLWYLHYVLLPKYLVLCLPLLHSGFLIWFGESHRYHHSNQNVPEKYIFVFTTFSKSISNLLKGHPK